MANKTIGVPGWTDKERFGVGMQYLEWLSGYGNPRIIMNWEEFVDVDMLFLPGGPDLAPGSYGEAPGFYTGNPCAFRQFFFEHRLKNYVDARTPIFGTCLGMQMINVHFGGTLNQNMKYYHADGDGEHKIIYTASDKKTYKETVTSSHHQCVKKLGENLLVIATADDSKKTVEAICHNELPICGVQFHPERLYSDLANTMIHKLLKS